MYLKSSWKIIVELERSGGESSVCYILQLPSGKLVCMIGGQILGLCRIIYLMRGIWEDILREETTRGVGEVQSLPGSSMKAALA